MYECVCKCELWYSLFDVTRVKWDHCVHPLLIKNFNAVDKAAASCLLLQQTVRQQVTKVS